MQKLLHRMGFLFVLLDKHRAVLNLWPLKLTSLLLIGSASHLLYTFASRYCVLLIWHYFLEIYLALHVGVQVEWPTGLLKYTCISIAVVLCTTIVLCSDAEESQLAKITRDSAKITVEQVHGLMSQVIKDILFNSVHQSNRLRTESSGPEPMVET
ncbi:unnamed protein product [Ilex paraguariensis]|uniref:Cop9 signalosome subunit 5 C-terminal domain-containing protein n=1 Tax=Ilex paraguariensis TaxID=185542 RepID=A0ABC8QW47_9AQUA